MSKQVVELGDMVLDLVTGYKGIAVTKSEWLNKCVRFAVQSQELKDGHPVEAVWFDEQQLQIVQKQAVVIVKEEITGGPAMRVEAQRPKDPTR